MIKQSQIHLTGLAGEPCPLIEIRAAFDHLVIGGIMILQVPHRDMWFHDNKPRLDDENRCWYLPENCDPPHTFSLAHVVREALNAICPEAPVGLETLNEETQKAYSEVSEGQGLWMFINLEIVENHIIARIKKI